MPVAMRRSRAVAAALLALAAALFAVAALEGDLRVGFFLFIPFVAGTGLVPFLAMLALVAAFVVFAAGSFAPTPDEARARHAPPPEGDAEARPRRARSGGVVLIGPLPIVWGSDRRVLPWMVAAGALLLLLAWLVFAR